MREFLAIERCDAKSCGAQAMHAVDKSTVPSELLFCNHHFQQYELALLADGWVAESNMKYYVPRSQSAAGALTE